MKLKTLIYISGITTPILSVILYLQGAPLKIRGVTDLGILDLEFAGTVPQAMKIYNAWHPSSINTTTNNIFIDFLFLISYGILLYAACLLCSRFYTAGFRKAGRIIAYLMIVAAAFDVFENVLMLSTLSAHFKKEIVAATFIFASIKFILVALGIIYIMLALAGQMLTIKKRAKSTLAKEVI